MQWNFLKLQIPNLSRSSLPTLPHSPESMPSLVIPWTVPMHFYSLSLLPTSSSGDHYPHSSARSSHIINLIMSLSSYGLEVISHCLQMESQVPTDTHLVFHCHRPWLTMLQSCQPFCTPPHTQRYFLPSCTPPSSLAWTPPLRELLSGQPRNSAQPLRYQLTVTAGQLL